MFKAIMVTVLVVIGISILSMVCLFLFAKTISDEERVFAALQDSRITSEEDLIHVCKKIYDHDVIEITCEKDKDN